MLLRNYSLAKNCEPLLSSTKSFPRLCWTTLPVLIKFIVFHFPCADVTGYLFRIKFRWDFELTGWKSVRSRNHLRGSQIATGAEWACWASWLQSRGQGHRSWCHEPHRGKNDISRDWNKAMYSFSYPYGLLKHINKSGFLHYCFVEGLEVVHKLLEKKGQALKECFGKSASLGGIWHALFTVWESSTCKSSEKPKEPSSKTSRDKARRPK